MPAEENGFRLRSSFAARPKYNSYYEMASYKQLVI